MPTDPESATLRIQRFNPDNDRKPFLQAFTVPLEPGTTILDALHWIKAELDGTLTFRRSCRHAICGSCAMNINGQNMLVCNKPLSASLDSQGEVVIRPLPFLPILKDLVVDRTIFWEHYQRVRPWLVPPAETPEHEFRVSPEEVAALRDAEKCIMCGACFSSCQVVAFNKHYLGPHALLKAFLRVMDPRDSAPSERLAALADDDGVFRCRTITNCIDACPKGLDPTAAIETLRRLVQDRARFERQRSERQQRLDTPIG